MHEVETAPTNSDVKQPELKAEAPVSLAVCAFCGPLKSPNDKVYTYTLCTLEFCIPHSAPDNHACVSWHLPG